MALLSFLPFSLPCDLGSMVLVDEGLRTVNILQPPTVLEEYVSPGSGSGRGCSYTALDSFYATKKKVGVLLSFTTKWIKQSSCFLY